MLKTSRVNWDEIITDTTRMINPATPQASLRFQLQASVIIIVGVKKQCQPTKVPSVFIIIVEALQGETSGCF